MLDIILKLIDRCIQLINERKKSNRELVSNYIDPILAEFEDVHASYLETFRTYQRSIAETSMPFTMQHAVFAKLQEDALFTAGVRQRLSDISTMSLPTELADFLIAIRLYLDNGDTTTIGHIRDHTGTPHYKNAIRIQIRIYLADIANSNMLDSMKVEDATEAIEGAIYQLQNRYAEVYQTANKLRFALLR